MRTTATRLDVAWPKVSVCLYVSVSHCLFATTVNPAKDATWGPGNHVLDRGTYGRHLARTIGRLKRRQSG